jgi:hypothetical protein
MAVDRQEVPASGRSFLTVHGESGGRGAEGEHTARNRC